MFRFKTVIMSAVLSMLLVSASFVFADDIQAAQPVEIGEVIQDKAEPKVEGFPVAKADVAHPASSLDALPSATNAELNPAQNQPANAPTEDALKPAHESPKVVVPEATIQTSQAIPLRFCVFRLNDAAIVGHTESIRKEMRWNKVARLGVEGAKWGIGIFTAYKILQSFGLIGGAAGAPAKVQENSSTVPAQMDQAAMQQKILELDAKVAYQAKVIS